MRPSSRFTLCFLGLGSIVVAYVVGAFRTEPVASIESVSSVDLAAPADSVSFVDSAAPANSVASPSSAVARAQGKQKRAAPSTLLKGQGCLTAKCHAPLTEGRYLHGPVAIERCGICHKQADVKKHKFEPVRNQSKLCNSCHEILILSNVHKPFADGECTVCHDPHHSPNPKLLIMKKPANLCAKCHETSKWMEKKFVHSALKNGDCTGCHNPHSSANPKMLGRRGSNVCLDCHGDLRPGAESHLTWHEPVKEDCAQCHDAHASDNAFQLKAPRKKLCLDCHEEQRRRIETSSVFHTALTTNAGCQNCHEPHMSKFPKLLKAPVIDLCLKCHDKPQLREDKSVVRAVGREIQNSKFKHGPIREGECSGCHDPHGSEHFRLLRGDFPNKFYSPFGKKKYALCFKCHESRMFTVEKTKTLTGFRNGDHNLHFLHVNDDKKGRTCRACHMTHASNHPKHIADSVPFGSWDIPLEFKKLPHGGSCAPGCHKPREYNVDVPVTYPRPSDSGSTSVGTKKRNPIPRKVPPEIEGETDRAKRTPVKKEQGK